jgi:transcriptional regulator with XRE-family HTH domain
MNQSGLAVMVGVSTATVTDWRHGRIQPRDENCKRLAQVLQVPITDVYAALGRIPEDAETPERIRELTELASRLSPEDQDLAVALLRQLVDRLQSRGGTGSEGTELEGQSA